MPKLVFILYFILAMTPNLFEESLVFETLVKIVILDLEDGDAFIYIFIPTLTFIYFLFSR